MNQSATLTIRQEYVPMYLVLAADSGEAVEVAYTVQRARHRPGCSEKRGRALWNMYWLCLMQHQEAVRKMTREGALLHYGSPAAVALARELEEKRSRFAAAPRV